MLCMHVGRLLGRGVSAAVNSVSSSFRFREQLSPTGPSAMDFCVQYLLEFKMSTYQLLLCVHNGDFPQVNISFNVFKQQIINDVQQF